MNSMEKLKGIAASPGIYIGKVFLFLEEKIDIPRYDIEPDKIEAEIERLRRAFEAAKNELENLKIVNSGIMTNGECLLIDTHIMMLGDPDFQEKIDNYLIVNHINAEAAVFESIKEFIADLSLSNNTYAKERISDFRDVARRVLGKLTARCLRNLSELSEECIVVSRDILPSDAIVMDKSKVRGLVMEAGGRTSHTAIIARAFGIPAVLGVSGILQRVKAEDTFIIDGYTGTVVINPDRETLEEYYESMEKNKEISLALQRYIKKKAETDDGKRILIKANIEFSEEHETVIAQGADGIGLFRTEFLLMQPEYMRDEEKQYRAYREILEKMGELPVTIRTLDVGGDKLLAEMDENGERNPLLGWRGIRYSLSERAIFKRQLRALFRASVHGTLRIMFPMIASMEELDDALALVSESKEELKAAGLGFRDDVAVGMMVEVPSTALEAESFAEKVDFFSIGSNDLIQYTMAMDRGNERVAYLYQPFHPAILKLVKMTSDAAAAKNIPVSVCGEIAADPLAAILLLGLGIDELSMSSQSISVIKKIIRNVTFDDAQETAAAVLKMRSGSEIHNYLRKKYNDKFGIYLQ